MNIPASKKALNHELPAIIKIPHNDGAEENREIGKKMAQDVDNSSKYSEKRYKMICHIQKLLKEGCSYREIVRRMGVGRNTIAKYRTGSKGTSADYITREGMFKHMWMNVSLKDIHKYYIYGKFPKLWELHTCIRNFGIFSGKRWLYFSIYSLISIKRAV